MTKSTVVSVEVQRALGFCSAPRCQGVSRIAVYYLSPRGRTSYRAYCLVHIPKTVGTPGPGPVLSLDGVEVYSLRAVRQALTKEELEDFNGWTEHLGVLPDDSVVVYKRDWDRWFEAEMRNGK